MAIMRMPRYDISNDGMGPFAIFYCDRCNREYRSNPSIAATVKESVTRGAFGGLLRNIPIIGDSAANQVENDRYRTNLSNDELQSAWGQTAQYFRECPSCHQIVCIPDFDEPTGFCDEHSPRAQQLAEAQAQQAGAALSGIANAFGVGQAIQASMAAAAMNAPAGLVVCPKDGTRAPVGTAFCPMCGTAMQAVAAAAGTPALQQCGKCGAGMLAGAKFCPNCGTPSPQAVACSKCGTTIAPGVKFCPNCGTAAA